jgi:hypothetical protein
MLAKSNINNAITQTTNTYAPQDIYGGQFVAVKDRAIGEVHILNAGEATARQSCCPVCPPDVTDKSKCRIHITQMSKGIYNVTIPEILNPGNKVGVLVAVLNTHQETCAVEGIKTLVLSSF